MIGCCVFVQLWHPNTILSWTRLFMAHPNLVHIVGLLESFLVVVSSMESCTPMIISRSMITSDLIEALVDWISSILRGVYFTEAYPI